MAAPSPVTSTLRLALVQVDPTVGDLAGNAALVRAGTARAAAEGAHLVLLPEMVLTGYPVEDLALRSAFVEASRDCVERLARELADDGHGDLPVLVGYLDRADADADGLPDADRVGRPKGSPQNAVALLRGGRVEARYVKHHLPNYGVFDEYRVFVPGDSPLVVRVRGVDVGVAVCEDLWQDGGPVAWYRDLEVGLLAVLNASPYEREKDDRRLELVRRRASEAAAPLAYCNVVGGQDELVFDGDSLVATAGGEVLGRAEQFAEALLVVDVDCAAADPGEAVPPPPDRRGGVAERLDDVGEVWSALVLGLRDYVRKNGFRSVVFGLSGGIDSAVVAALAADAVGGANVVGLSMPSRWSSEHSKDDAALLAERIGADYRVQPIAPLVEAFEAQLPLEGLAAENLQARVRGVLVMAVSNSEGHLALATGNKTELAVGYSTIYGDSVGGFAPLKDVPKTLVWELARWRNAQAEARGEVPPVPESSITKPPSAELRPGQVDQDSLPPYDLLDEVLEDYVEGDRGMADLLAEGFDPEVVDRVVQLVDRAEWKRRQYAPGPKTSMKAFGRDRRLPITSRWREHQPPAAPAP